MWQIFLNLKGISWTMPSKIDETLFNWEEAGLGTRNRSRWRMIMTCIWWTTWRERNDRYFENRSNNLHEVKLKCILLSVFGVQMSIPMRLRVCSVGRKMCFLENYFLGN
ncbi:hypothetical protein MTR67_051446 [Solanum verrucosum]|uniref:Uncharacterized protein n=1 Tax=Solanum verrucosum TaxID=315347 RepID=A0AAF0V7F9_SOLVR|nr:hypothetical protein MTR67_051446 [Solanum verrucosum]